MGYHLEIQRHCCSISSAARVLQVPKGFRNPIETDKTQQCLSGLHTSETVHRDCI